MKQLAIKNPGQQFYPNNNCLPDLLEDAVHFAFATTLILIYLLLLFNSVQGHA